MAVDTLRGQALLTVFVRPYELGRAWGAVPRRGEAQHRREVGRELLQVGDVPVVDPVEIWSDGDDSDSLGDVGWPRQKLGRGGGERGHFSVPVFGLESASEFYFATKGKFIFCLRRKQSHN